MNCGDFFHHQGKISLNLLNNSSILDNISNMDHNGTVIAPISAAALNLQFNSILSITQSFCVVSDCLKVEIIMLVLRFRKINAAFKTCIMLDRY